MKKIALLSLTLIFMSCAQENNSKTDEGPTTSGNPATAAQCSTNVQVDNIGGVASYYITVDTLNAVGVYDLYSCDANATNCQPLDTFECSAFNQCWSGSGAQGFATSAGTSQTLITMRFPNFGSIGASCFQVQRR